MDYSILKRRYIGLDIFRIISAIVICAFHTTIHLGADYGIFQPVSIMGAVFMTAFFMLSGYSLFVNYSKDNLMNIQCLKIFWCKRIIGIIPMYYIASILYILSNYEKELILQEIILAPIEILSIQSNFSSLFSFSHNGGTWFISCIIMCYLFYPFIQEVAKQMSYKVKSIVIIICCFVLLYSPIVVKVFQLQSIYSNPFFRILEFVIGLTLASLKFDLDKSNIVKKYIYKWKTVFLVSFIMIACITVLVKLNIGIGNYMLYSIICLPCFILILVSLSGVNSVHLENSKILKYCCSISYVFFLAQLFSNRICKQIIVKYNITNNIFIIFLGWLVCIVIAVIMHEVFEKPVTKFIKRKLNNVISQ